MSFTSSQIGKSKFQNVDVAQMVSHYCTHAIFFQDGEISVGSNVYSSYSESTPGLLCKIDMEHIEESNYSENYTLADWVDETIDAALEDEN